MLDGGATKTVVSDRLARELNLTRMTKNTRLHTVEGVSHRPRQLADLEICNLAGDLCLEVPSALIGDFLTTSEDKPPRNEEIIDFDYLDGVKFDELNHDRIDAIISVEFSWTWLGGEMRRSTKDKPICLKSLFGWTMAGSREGSTHIDSCLRTALEIDNGEIHAMVTQLFNRDFPEIPVSEKHDSLDDEHALQQLRQTIRFDKELGHYRVGLPWKHSREAAAEVLNPIDSSGHARNRLLKATKRIKAGKTKMQWDQVKTQMQGMFEDKHARFIEPSEVPPDVPSWVLPLHFAYQPHKPTKPRCCQDSRSTLQGTCLNDNLLTGPDMLNSLLGIIFRFRLHKIVLSADIKGFFHQIYVDERDVLVNQFWWYEDDECSKPKLCVLDVHIFGAKSSPTVSTFVLRHHGEIHKGEISPEVAWAIIRSFYIDDFLASYADVDKARQVRLELTQVLAKGGFELLKWNSNDPRALDDCPGIREDEKSLDDKDELPQDAASLDRILGVRFSFKKDHFLFYVKPEKVMIPVNTRCELLKVMACCFDPFGVAAPNILILKLLFQTSIRDKTKGWDDQLPDEVKEAVAKWQTEVPHLSTLTIPRWLKSDATVDAVADLHIFADASRYGYGYCAYRRAQVDETVDLRFLFGKARVIPADAEKTRHHNSIPRFELTAATAASEFYLTLLAETEEKYGRIFFWTDSECVLKQIRDTKLRQDTFVANRLSKIRANTNVSDWHHVETINNPADIASRGLKSTDTKGWDIYHNGPAFLRDPKWVPPDPTTPISIAATAGEEMEEDREEEINPLELPSRPWLLQLADKYSRWSDKCRIIARIQRCARKWRLMSKLGRGGTIPPLTQEEIDRSELMILKEIQQKYFSKEFQLLKVNKVRKPQIRTNVKLANSSIKKFNPFLDEDGLIRSSTRLINAESLTYNVRCPIILPKEDQNVDCLIRSFHQAFGHSGIDFIRNQLRQKYLILSDGMAVKKVLNKCAICQKIFKAPAAQQMAPLPVDRLSVGQPFEVTGADLFGPYELKWGKKGKTKRWVIIFTCLKIRAVHFDILETISAPSLLNAVIRLKSLFPAVRKIYSDSGNNFLGSEKLLEKAIANFAMAGESSATPPLEWQRLPPHSSHRGGVWERLIKSTKRILAALLGKGDVELDVFNTVLHRAAFILNHRPITHLSNDPSDLAPLTPAHFMLAGSDVIVSDPSAPLGPVGATDLRFSHQRGLNLINGFWKRWLREYVTTLRNRSKWQDVQPELQQGQLVLMVDELKIRPAWKLGRINALISSDGLIRTADVLTASGRTFRRDITKLIPLELD